MVCDKEKREQIGNCYAIGHIAAAIRCTLCGQYIIIIRALAPFGVREQ